MKQLTNRQYQIYAFIQSQGSASNAEIRAHIKNIYGDLSRITIVREIDYLLKNQHIKKEGAGRSIRYFDFNDNVLLKYYDPKTYYALDSDQRKIQERFNFNVFNHFTSLFSKTELAVLNNLTEEYRTNLTKIHPEIFRKEIERLTIELSWKSSQIEGNTYTLLDTEALLKEEREAPGHKKEEAVMLLNHKRALDYIFSSPNSYHEISLRKIEDIHRLLVENLSIGYGLRNSIVSITGTNYRPLDNHQQIKEAINNMNRVLKSYSDPFHKSLSAVVLLSYIQPFIDGNKRTARLVGNAILSAAEACPLSYRSVDSVEYKKAMLLFYEQNSLEHFKSLFMTQYEFSVKHYFLN